MASDGRYVDLDGGGTTLGFSGEAVEFDWGVAIPSGTQLIVVVVEGWDNVFGPVSWGYGTPVNNGDGVASNAAGTTRLLEISTISPNPWGAEFPAELRFYAFEGDFRGVNDELFVSLDDHEDTEIDAVQVIAGGAEG